VAIFVLNQMQMLNEQVAPTRSVGQQRLDIGDGLQIVRGGRRRPPRPVLSAGGAGGSSVRLIRYPWAKKPI
jgi:hypothetical protein